MSDGSNDAWRQFFGSRKSQADWEDALWDEDEIDRLISDAFDPVCECGSHRTYGKDCSPQMHSNWCPAKRG